MKVFIVLSCIALAVAKPQGYAYNQPSSSGVGAGLSAPGTAPAPSFTGSSASFSSGSFASGSSLSAGSQSFSAGPQSFSAGSQSFSTGSSLPSAQSFAAAPAAPAFSAQQQSYQPAAHGPVEQITVHKHIYVHVPPPSLDDAEPSNAAAPAPAQKHYKIIFIKAPSAPAIDPNAFRKLAQPQTEEKTIVYVLAKKPESLDDLARNAQPASTTEPSKPEVYFIKYKTQKEAAEQQAAPAPSAPIDTESTVVSADEPAAAAPAQSYGAPAPAPSNDAPAHQPAQTYGAAPQPQSNYAPQPAPHQPASTYGVAH